MKIIIPTPIMTAGIMMMTTMAGTAATLGTATAATGIPIGKNQLAGSETTSAGSNAQA